MDKSCKKISKFENQEDYIAWVNAQSWYQSIPLQNGYCTPGKFPTQKRLPWFDQFDFVGKTVLDIGCNSGQYSLYAKRKGAVKVTGIDVDANRINQAATLSANEEVDVDFQVMGLDGISDLGVFDITLCIAVVTEVENVIGALRGIRKATGKIAIIEMGLSQSVFNISRSKRWWVHDSKVSRRGRAAEMYRHKHAGWVMFPSLEIVQDIFGDDFEVSHEGHGLRYEKVVARRR